jgi:hypothetical protein
LDDELDSQPCLPIKNLTIKVENQTQQFTIASVILDPSFNYEKPNYTSPNGETLTTELVKITSKLVEIYTRKTHYQNEDITFIGNRRVLYDRKAIIGDSTDSEAFIGVISPRCFYCLLYLKQQKFYKRISLSIIALLASGKVN